MLIVVCRCGGCACGRQVERKLAVMKDNFLQVDARAVENAVDDASMGEFWYESGLATLYQATRVVHVENDTLACFGGCGMGRARPFAVAALKRRLAVAGKKKW